MPPREDNMDEKTIKRLIDEKFKAGFGERVGDTPTDALQLVPRKYVNMYGSIAGLPAASVIGQQYFATDLGRPLFRRQDGKWVDGAGSINA